MLRYTRGHPVVGRGISSSECAAQVVPPVEAYSMLQHGSAPLFNRCGSDGGGGDARALGGSAAAGQRWRRAAAVYPGPGGLRVLGDVLTSWPLRSGRRSGCAPSRSSYRSSLRLVGERAHAGRCGAAAVVAARPRARAIGAA